MSEFLLLQLPSGVSEKINFSSALMVSFLKNTVEKLYGIPYELQVIKYNGNILNDDKVLQEEGIIDGSNINVEVDVWWAKLISCSLQGDYASIKKRLSVPMQQVDQANWIFISLFISAARGDPSALVNILNFYNDFDIKTTTRMTGRTILHAAVCSGSLKCVEEIKKRASLQFEQLLYLKDKSGCSPLGCLTSNNARMMNYINKFISNPIKIEQLENNSHQSDVEIISNTKKN